VALFLCFTFAWAYYALLLLPLVIVTLPSDRWGTWLVRGGLGMALALPVLVDTVSPYPGPHAQDGVAALGLIVVLVGTVVHGREMAGAGTDPGAIPGATPGATPGTGPGQSTVGANLSVM
jgi:hypothetical protein